MKRGILVEEVVVAEVVVAWEPGVVSEGEEVGMRVVVQPATSQVEVTAAGGVEVTAVNPLFQRSLIKEFSRRQRQRRVWAQEAGYWSVLVTSAGDRTHWQPRHHRCSCRWDGVRDFRCVCVVWIHCLQASQGGGVVPLSMRLIRRYKWRRGPDFAVFAAVRPATLACQS